MILDSIIDSLMLLNNTCLKYCCFFIFLFRLQKCSLFHLKFSAKLNELSFNC